MTQWNTKTWRSAKRTWAVCHVSLLPCQHRNFSKGHHILTSNSGWIWADFELETSGILLYWFPRAVVTSYHNLDGLQLQEHIITQFWKRQAQPLGVGNSESPWRAPVSFASASCLHFLMLLCLALLLSNLCLGLWSLLYSCEASLWFLHMDTHDGV